MAEQDAAHGAEAGLGVLPELFAQLDAAGLPERTLGAPRQVGEYSVLPLAEVWYGRGVGLGGGDRAAAAAGTGQSGYGGGAGGGGRLRPLAVVEVGPAGVRVHPVLDPVALALALVPLAAVALLRWRRGRRRRR